MSFMSQMYEHDFPREHRTQSVAEHEVLISFLDDEGAEVFREWWAEKGQEAFDRWSLRKED
jgi:hypothetical protein